MAFQQQNMMDEYVPMHQQLHYGVPQMGQREPPMSREPKGKRKQVGRACAQCAAAHVACSEHRPCTRCSKRGIPCQDRERKRRRRLEHDEDGGDDPMIATAGFMIPPHNPLGPMYLPPMGPFPPDYPYPEYFHKGFGGFDDKMPRGFSLNEPGSKQEEMFAMHPEYLQAIGYPHGHPHEEYPSIPAGYPYSFQGHFLPHPTYAEDEPLPGQVLQSTNDKFPQAYSMPGFFPQFENLPGITPLPATTLPAPSVLLPSTTQPQGLPQGLPSPSQQGLSQGLSPVSGGPQALSQVLSSSPQGLVQGLPSTLAPQGLSGDEEATRLVKEVKAEPPKTE